MKSIKKALEKLYFALPREWKFEESENRDIVLMIGDTCYAFYDNSERTLNVNAVFRDINATFYVCTDKVTGFDVKRTIMRFIDAEGSLVRGIHKGFILMTYAMGEGVLEEQLEEEAEYIRPTVAGQECSWWARPDGITYLKDERGQLVTAYDRSEMTYMLPFSDKIVPIPAKKSFKDEATFREVLETQAIKTAKRMEGGAV